MDLVTLKKEYSELSKKHKLPAFKELNGDFEVEKIERESDYILRVVRKVMMEKIVNSLNFLELLMNPANAPKMYIGYIRTMSVEDRKEIDKMYGSIGDLSIQSLALEIDYSEKSEAELINKIFNTWNANKPSFKKIISNMNRPNKPEVKKDKTYFG